MSTLYVYLDDDQALTVEPLRNGYYRLSLGDSYPRRMDARRLDYYAARVDRRALEHLYALLGEFLGRSSDGVSPPVWNEFPATRAVFEDAAVAKEYAETLWAARRRVDDADPTRPERGAAMKLDGQCGRDDPHPKHRWIVGNTVYQCHGVVKTYPVDEGDAHEPLEMLVGGPLPDYRVEALRAASRSVFKGTPTEQVIGRAQQYLDWLRRSSDDLGAAGGAVG